MGCDSATPTRRSCLKYGAAILGGGLLAGCTGDTGSDSSPTDGSGATDATGSPSGSSTVGGPYSVAIEPVGEVQFESVPKTWVANNGSWADMGVALGQEPPKAVYLTSRYHTQYYDDIPGVSVDTSKMKDLWGDSGVGKEQFLALDADVHVLDPNFLTNRSKWKQSDVDQIREEVGPFFGNSIFSRSYPWHNYRYYTLYEAFGKLAAVFKQRDRYEAFVSIHDEFQSSLSNALPAKGERPSAAVVWASGDEPTEFYPYIVSEGTSFKHLRDLGVDDALANSDVKDFHSNRGAIDFETLLEVDPEVLLVRGQEAKSRSKFESTVVRFMEDHDVASDLTAVQNGDVYRAGPLYQGPITNLVVTERLARELYGVENSLFDRKRVGDVVAGNF